MSAKYENVFYATIYNERGFTERDFFQVRDIVNASKPNYWILLQPSTIDVYFLSDKDGKQRCDNFVVKMKELKRSSLIFQHLGIASSLEKIIVERNIFGKLKSPPLFIGGKTNVHSLAIEDSKKIVGP